ncbi:hypothetical protein [Chryseolinea sp. H1M3-3]|uniref:hypothetical protein n=1 Tax=Chryseolinea sp. H1M3-3 TaxID=3034144 RepID=UPI0023ED0DB5|nr:hypothetical protein [Chryseolinea sp. H1M3-3]
MRLLLFFLCLQLSSGCIAQAHDSPALFYVYATAPFQMESGQPTTPAADSSSVEVRSFDEAAIQKLRSDKDLQYNEIPTVAESLWQRLLMWIVKFFATLFSEVILADWTKILWYGLSLAAIVVVIMILLRVNAFKVFYAGEGASTLSYHVLEEDIHNLDFDKLIREAIGQRDYRKAIRLLFLQSLKLLADKNLIQWEQGKTNHDYLSELTGEELKRGFKDLNYYFEYAWYGNFAVSNEMFLKVQRTFMEWRSRIQ